MKKSIFILLLFGQMAFGQNIYKEVTKLMGSRFDLSVVANDSVEAQQYIDIAKNEIIRIEKLISSWDSLSQTSNINKNAGIKPVKVDKELFDLIERSLAISKITQGAFDITYASMDRIWKFDGSMSEMPSDEEIKSSVERVGYEKVILDKENQTVYLSDKGMKIGFGAIGKGYAADKAKKLLMELGVKAGIINASGDMNTWGTQPNGVPWYVAITNPLNKKNSFAKFPLVKSAVVTSGDYEKYVTFNGIRYTHIIDPRTGYPAHGIISATVFSSSAEMADAFATSVFVLGVENGIALIDQIPDLECIIIDEKGNIHQSKNIQIEN